jgi:N-methylhydantoinase A
MLPIGGAGPVHAAHIARKLGVTRVVCPLGAGVASAFGFLAAPTSFSFVRGRLERLDSIDFGSLNQMLDAIDAEGRDLLATAGAPTDQVTVVLAAAMRYVGQGYEIDVDLDRESVARGQIGPIIEAFERTYARYFGRTEPGVPVEVVSWRMVVRGPTVDIELARTRPHEGEASQESVVPKTWRKAWFEARSGFVDTPVYDRYALRPGTCFEGPALVEERESTVVVPPDAGVRCDESLNLIIDLR